MRKHEKIDTILSLLLPIFCTYRLALPNAIVAQP